MKEVPVPFLINARDLSVKPSQSSGVSDALRRRFTHTVNRFGPRAMLRRPFRSDSKGRAPSLSLSLSLPDYAYTTWVTCCSDLGVLV